jgi:cell division septum initiation protein DivIVA
VQKTQTSLFLALKSAPAKAQQLLQPVQDAVNDLVEQTYHVCQRFANVDNYITVQRANKDLEGEIAILELKLAGATDEQVRKEYEEALSSLREQADNLKQMTNLLERFETQLTTLTSTLERVQANAIRLQTMDEGTIRAEIPDLLKWIEAQSQELKGFEKQAG